VRVTAAPFHVDGQALGPAGPAPYRPGEDTRTVLAEILGYASDRIEALARRGAVVGPGLPAPEAGPLAGAAAAE
jgi:crotonobetainyl-CoA:carnitine CoA-transferase CaiB-like acyl-CoA transferase